MKIVVSFSGGMDSTTLLKKALYEKTLYGGKDLEVIPVSFRYPSKHNEWEFNVGYDFLCANGFHPAKDKDLPWRHTFNVSGIFDSFTSSLLHNDDAIPEGHYEAENMRQTVVPGRNLIFTSILAGYAESIGAGEVWLGIHAGDHFIYPDCRPEFFEHAKQTVERSSDGKVTLKAPFLYITKVEILQLGIKLGVDYSKTRTCYKDQPVACGKCGSCQERLTAFKTVGVEDPLEYESRELLPK